MEKTFRFVSSIIARCDCLCAMENKYTKQTEQIRILRARLRDALKIAMDRLDWADAHLDKPSRSAGAQRIGKQCRIASDIASSVLDETEEANS
jgi:hypothetical protein